MLSSDDLHQLFALGHEIRSFEVKGPGQLADRHYTARVARAVMAMGNLRDGGLVCLGVADGRVGQMLPGLDDAQLRGWSDFDNVTDALAQYSDPPVTFGLNALDLASGAKVVVLEVMEFEHVPHVCKREYQGVLQKGQTYVRPRGKPESVPVPSSMEMRELLDLAITKGVRDFVGRAGAAGLDLGRLRSPEDVEREQFELEAKKAWADSSSARMSLLTSGFTDVAIRPRPFEHGRLSPSQLEPFVTEQVVRLRGWPVPYVDQRSSVQRHGTWIGQDIEPEVVPHNEAWRMCTSGQFLHRRVLSTDLRKHANFQPTHAAATGTVAIWDVLLYLIEVAEFGARAVTALRCNSIEFSISLNGVAGRELVSGDWARELNGPYLVKADRLAAVEVVDSATLLANPRSTGVDLAQRLLRQFGLELPDQVLLDWQQQILVRSS